MLDVITNEEPKRIISTEGAAPGILLLKFTEVNACIVTDHDTSRWMLVDTGPEGCADLLCETIQNVFGDKRPVFIVLTHGHSDNAGNAKELMNRWRVTAYAQKGEIPYLQGKKNYRKSGQEAISETPALGSYLLSLPSDGMIPMMPDWEWIATPGHTEGHISLFRERDGVLIVGDAFHSIRQYVFTQDDEIKIPPAYDMQDRNAALDSIEIIRKLKPKLAIFSHGQTMSGGEITNHLLTLTKKYDLIYR